MKPDPWKCPEAIDRHGPPDAYGRCPWCKQKYENKRDRPPGERGLKSEIDKAYEMFYDPDWGAT